MTQTTTHSDATDDSRDGGASTRDSLTSKADVKKTASEQKVEYSKMSHGISINIANVGMSNSCGSTQLPRIAEEKDSPTGTKSDDYTPKEITEKAGEEAAQAKEERSCSLDGKRAVELSESFKNLQCGTRVSHQAKTDVTDEKVVVVKSSSTSISSSSSSCVDGKKTGKRHKVYGKDDSSEKSPPTSPQEKSSSGENNKKSKWTLKIVFLSSKT